MTEWPSKRGPITKIMPSDGCTGDTVPLAVGKLLHLLRQGQRPHEVAEIVGQRVKLQANRIVAHKYGPHIFHTNSRKVWSYLARFTEWRLYEHRVLAAIDGKKVPIPFNLNSLHALLPSRVAEKLEYLLVPPEDVPALADALVDLALNPDKCKALGQAARARIAEHYAWTTTARRVLSLCEDAAAGRA